MGLILLPQYNDSSWYREHEQVNIDRVSMLALVGAIEVALVKHTWSRETEQVLRVAGGLMAKRLLMQGLVLPGERRLSWERIFRRVL